MAKKAAKTKKPNRRVPRNNIAVDQPTNELIEAACVRYKTQKAKFVETLVGWFGESPESMQGVIAGNVPVDMGEEYFVKACGYFATRLRIDTPSLVKEAEQTLKQAKSGTLSAIGAAALKAAQVAILKQSVPPPPPPDEDMKAEEKTGA